MKIDFKRIISSGSFIPEIDGLRFIAISSVVFYHLYWFITAKDVNNYSTTYDFSIFYKFLSNGNLGVPLFFVISGFILGRPFANSYINNKEKINIKKYFLRRVTRLEPPYILVMTLLLIGAVFVANTLSLKEGSFSYLASITYTHNFFYERGIHPLLNGVAWSLEIEIQFYLLAPLLGHVFKIKNFKLRRLILILTSVLFIIFDYFETLPFISIFNYLEYFLIGFLLVDLFISKDFIFKKTRVDSIISLFFLIGIFVFNTKNFDGILAKMGWEIFQLGAIFLFYYFVLFHKSLKLLKNNIITNIGGMCYTIYLLHFPLISIFGNPLVNIKFFDNPIINIAVYSLLLIIIVLIISSFYFLLIERPCMKRDWYKNLRARTATN